MKPALGAILNSPAARRRRAETRALMHLGLVEYGARMGHVRPDEAAARLRVVVDELEAIGPTLARQVRHSA